MRAAHDPFALNLVDSVMFYAPPPVAKWLDIIGQGGERAYRKALLPIFDAHVGAPKERVAELIETLMVSLCLLAIAAHERLDEERGADLTSFLIQRVKHMELS